MRSTCGADRRRGRRPVRLALCLGLSACEGVGDFSETVGAHLAAPLHAAGGGYPELSEDGGAAVTWYLHQVAADSYAECAEWREDVREVNWKDEEAVEPLKARAEEIESDFQVFLDEMSFGLGLQLNSVVGGRLGGGLLMLDSCSLQGCDLGCEAVVEVQEVMKDDGLELMSWETPQDLLTIGERRTDDLHCMKHPRPGRGAGVVDPNYEAWRRSLALAGGADAETVKAYTSPRFQMGWAQEDDADRKGEVVAGDSIRFQVHDLNACLELDGAMVRLQPDLEPTLDSVSIECADGAEAVAADADVEDGEEVEERPADTPVEGDEVLGSAAQDLTEDPVPPGSLVIEFSVSSPGGALGLGFGGPGMGVELMVLDPRADDTGIGELVFHHRKEGLRCDLSEEAKAVRSSKEMRKVLEEVLEESAFTRISEDSEKIHQAYLKHVRTDPDEKLECRLVLEAQAMKDFSCDAEEQDYQYRIIFRDQERRWSKEF